MANQRLVDVVTPLGDAMWFRQMSGTEALSELFEYDVTFHSKKSGLSAKAMLGKDVTLMVETNSQGVRHFNGLCTRFASGGREGEHMTYTAKLRPWLWIASRASDCKIFQRKTVPQIIDEVLEPYGKPKSKLTKSYRQWEYCVQYEETDLNFVMRLMEHEGIYFYFEHRAGVHEMVLVDDMNTHLKLPEKPIIKYHGIAASGEVAEEHFNSWDVREEIDSGNYASDDYDFQHPRMDLKTKQGSPKGHVHDHHERYTWPGGYIVHSDGDRYAGVRLESLQSEYERAQGHTTVRTMAPGYLFTLERCPRADQNRQYLAVEVTYFFRDNARMSSGSGDGDATWGITVTSQPTALPYRPQPLTPKPRTNGPQTALVVGPSGNEIHTEKYGRVKVQFHWDRVGTKNENSSCFIRVGTPLAGGKWGMIQIPRIGQEVIVDFLCGDPDQPIIIGSVYNEAQPVPYELPKYEAIATWKSHSTPNGTPKDYNELRFDDRYGKEQVFIHAQRRMDVRVKQNKYETVQGASHTLVGGGHYLTTGKNLEVHVKGEWYARSDNTIQLTAGGAVKVVGEKTIQISSDASIEVNATSKILLESRSAVTLKVAGNFITVDATGVTIQGTMVRINSGGMAMGTSEFDAEHPYDASEADTGEPGYLDNRPSGGGGWAKRGSSKGGQHHAPTTVQRGKFTVTVDREKKTITIAGKQQFFGDGATQGVADNAVKSMNDTWSGPTKFEGENYAVKTEITGSVRNASGPADPSANQMQVKHTTDPPNVHKNNDPANQPYNGSGPGMIHDNEDAGGTLTIPHEMGHAMGLKDEYSEGPRDASGNRTIVRTGPAGGLMGYIDPGSKPTEQNYNDLVTGNNLGP